MSPSLGDLLNNNEERENQINQALVVGSVFKMTLSKEEGVTPKNPGDVTRDKLFVVIGFVESREPTSDFLRYPIELLYQSACRYQSSIV